VKGARTRSDKGDHATNDQEDPDDERQHRYQASSIPSQPRVEPLYTLFRLRWRNDVAEEGKLDQQEHEQAEDDDENDHLGRLVVGLGEIFSATR
jgi:hypothetical protein